jgi:serine/threonine-protein kinase
VPSVIGQSQDHAIASLANAGLTAVPTTTTRCDTAANGNVVSQSPVGGTSVPRGRQVTISTCSAPALVVVPTVIGQTQDQATASLATAGLTAVPGPVGCRGLHIPNGDVGIQSPAGGTSAPRSSNVTIGICSTFVQIPAVIGKTRDQAIDALTSAGLTANVSTTTDCDTTANGTVTAQAPDGGTSAPQGTGVAITVCDNPPPPSS